MPSRILMCFGSRGSGTHFPVTAMPRRGVPIPEFSSQIVPLLDPQSLASLFGVIPS